ncbi:MAG: hypothetical protein ACLUPK_05220 [Veillonella sp.]
MLVVVFIDVTSDDDFVCCVISDDDWYQQFLESLERLMRPKFSTV